jgi:hypothetical protein
MLSLLAREKVKKLEQEETRIKTEKLPFWLEPLDSCKIQKKWEKICQKVKKLETEEQVYQNLIVEGEKVKQQCNEPKRVYSCQKALNGLNVALKKQKKVLLKYQKKAKQWEVLHSKGSGIDSQQLEEFQKAKHAKWKTRLEKIEIEKKAVLISITNNVITLARQTLTICSVATGFGIINLPCVVNIVLDTYITGTSMMAFLQKRSAKKIKIISIHLNQFIN